MVDLAVCSRGADVRLDASFDRLPDELIVELASFLVPNQVPKVRSEATSSSMREGGRAVVNLLSCSRRLRDVAEEYRLYSRAVEMHVKQSGAALTPSQRLDLYLGVHRLIEPHVALSLLVPVQGCLFERRVELSMLIRMADATTIDPAIRRLARDALCQSQIFYIPPYICFIRLEGSVVRMRPEEVPGWLRHR